MMRCFLLFSFLLVALNSVAQFRQTTWAMNKQQIKTVETAELIEETDQTLTYRVKVGDREAMCTYYFESGVFYMAAYQLLQVYHNKEQYIGEYFKIKDLLSEKYGSPQRLADEIWTNDKYKDNQQMRGFAVSLGHLVFQNSFSTLERNMEIVPLLSGKDFNITLQIQYINPYYSKQKKNNSF